MVTKQATHFCLISEEEELHKMVNTKEAYRFCELQDVTGLYIPHKN